MKFKTSIEKRLSGRHKKCMVIENFKNKKILDIGCSYGWFEKFKSKEAKEIVGIDLNKEDLEIAKKEVKARNVKFLYGSALELDFQENYFDMVVMFDVIEHLPKGKEEKVLEEINRVLKKNGLLIISTPVNNLSKFFDLAFYFRHRHYSLVGLINLLDKNGFKIKKAEIKGGFWELFSMLMFYPFKWIFNAEIPLKSWFDKKRNEEYKKPGFVTLFVIAKNEKRNFK